MGTIRGTTGLRMDYRTLSAQTTRISGHGHAPEVLEVVQRVCYRWAVTNELGARIAEWRMALFDDDAPLKGTTLGAYRVSKHMPWVPGAQIDVWAPCARAASAPDVPWPHAYFIQTQGGAEENDRSIYCPSCRVERAALRATRPAAVSSMVSGAAASKTAEPATPSSSASQSALPF